jgi:transcription antitermination factor NusG
VNETTDERSWFALQVKTTHEKRVASMFDHRGYEWFLPLYKSRRRWSDRTKLMELPLFQGYLFCRFAPRDRVPVLKTPSVLRIVGIGLTPTPIDEHEIAALQRVMNSRQGVLPHPFMQVGQRVRIESGSLAGLEGFIADIWQRDRLILSVALLQRSVAVEIDNALVAPVHGIPHTRQQVVGASQSFPNTAAVPPQ